MKTRENIKHLYTYLIGILLMGLSLQAQSQEGYVTARDSSIESIERYISQDKIDDYRSQPAYNYDENPEYSDDLLGSLWLRFNRWLERVLGGSGYGILGDIIYYGLILIAIVVVVVFVSRAQGHNPFYRTERKSKNAVAVDLIDENSSIESIDKLIEKAEKSKEFRLAIRLHYLRSLRLLDSANIISWRSGKTNSDYLNEIDDNGIKENFDNLSYIYEYCWYGQFEVDSYEQYQRLKDPFHTLFQNLNR